MQSITQGYPANGVQHAARTAVHRVLRQLLFVTLCLLFSTSPHVAGCATVTDAAQVLYRASSNCKIWAVLLPSARWQGNVLVMEMESGGALPGTKGIDVRYRLIWLQVPDGGSRPIGEVVAPLTAQLLYSSNDAVAMFTGSEGKDKVSGVSLLLPEKGWASFIPPDRYLRLIPVWSPDSTRLLYARLAADAGVVGSASLVVATVGEQGAPREKEVISLPSLGVSAGWSNDGREIIVVMRESDGKYRLLEIGYPSRSRQVIQAASSIGHVFSVPATGGLRWFASQDGKPPFHLWKRDPGAVPEEQKTTLETLSTRLLYSPDGDMAAEIPDGNSKAVIRDLNSGRSMSLALPREAQVWAFTGKGILCSDREKVMLVPVPLPVR